MDQHVAKNATRRLDVGRRGRPRVTAGDHQHLGHADLAARLIVLPYEAPVSALLALLGAPLLTTLPTLTELPALSQLEKLRRVALWQMKGLTDLASVAAARGPLRRARGGASFRLLGWEHSLLQTN